MNLKNRVKNIFNQGEKNVDLIVIKNGSEPFIDTNFFYVTDLKKGLFEGCAAVLYPSGDVDLVVSKLEEGLAQNTDNNVISYKNKNDFENILKDLLKKSKTIGLNYNAISHRFYQKLEDIFIRKEFLDISEDLMHSRTIKDSNEVELIKKACRISDKVAGKIPDLCKKGMYEYELAAEIDYLLEKNGADNPSFLTISSFGKNSANPHYSHGNYKLKEKDIILCDFGASYQRYNSDITRVFVMGKPSKKQIEMYNTVKEAQKIGIENIRSRIEGKVVHNKVDDFINSTKFKGLFIHSTGHSLGMDVHDGGVGFNSECDVELKEDMVLTVEPGIYIKDFGGIRIEDDILVKKDKALILSKAKRNFIEI